MTTTLEQLVRQIGEKLKALEWKLVTAESCTGGGLAYVITELPGSSAWFERGFVTYSNRAKQECLGVKSQMLEQFGAVSEETVRAMAEGALQVSQAQISLAITGIAGPEGGTADKPVGTVWVGYAMTRGITHATRYQFSGSRQQIRQLSIEAALKHICQA